MEGAEKIFEELALRYDEPRAWQSIGEIKFKQLESGKATVAQALNCFIKSVNPLLKVEDESKKQTQKVFEGLALSYAMDFTPKIWKIKEKTFKNKKDKELLWFYETTKWELFQAVNNFCFDNKEVYSEFLNTLKKFSPSGFLKKGTSLVSSTGYDMLTTDMYASMRAEAKQRVEKMWKEAKDNLKNSI